jgi:WD40 repeat protein
LHLHTILDTTLAFSPDGTLLATGESDGTITLWDVKTRQALGILKGHRAAISHLAFSPDGRVLLSSSNDGTLRLWAVSTAETF